jgi:hypothetical protein
MISTEDSEIAIRVLEHIKLHGLGGLPMEKGNRIRILAKDIGAGRYYKPGVPMKLFSRCYIWYVWVTSIRGVLTSTAVGSANTT